MPNDQSGIMYQTQCSLEVNAVNEGVRKYNKLCEQTIKRGEGAALKPVERLMTAWYANLRTVITKERTECAKGNAGWGRSIYGPHILMLGSDRLAIITMREALGTCLCDPNHNTTLKVALAIGASCSAQWALPAVKKDADAWHKLLHSDRRQVKPKHVNRVAKVLLGDQAWSRKAQIHIGAKLLELLMSVALVPCEGKPAAAFSAVRSGYGRNKPTYLRLSGEARHIISEGHAIRELLAPQYSPMVIKPMPWADEMRGGYVKHDVQLVKPTLLSKPVSQPKAIYDGINAVNSAAWRVNRRILDVVDLIWSSGGNVGKMPPLADVEFPDKPEGWQEADSAAERWANVNPDAKKQWKSAASDAHYQQVIRDALRISFVQILDTAKKFARYPEIYFPHQLDFRGRAYPVPLYLHQQGHDICRALLEFAEPKPLTDTGRRWLAIHLANCCGIDKVSFDQREHWVLSQMPRWRAWNEDPAGNCDWIDVDKPFQALAAGLAFVNDDAGERLPIQLDGSNNALQHYAAMLRDENMAEKVNLAPADGPSDVYDQLRIAVTELLTSDAGGQNRRIAFKSVKQGTEYDSMKLARFVLDNGLITRKVVKRPCMTYAYGVTANGMRTQIREELAKLHCAEDMQYPAGYYLAELCARGLQSTCPAAHVAMRTMQEWAKIIVKASSQPIRWTNPLGFEVTQPYYATSSYQIYTLLQAFSVAKLLPGTPARLSKQTHGIAPNFVHSIDGSHMLKTATALHAEGITFAAVHDSYWTHAATVSRMADVTRQSFMDIHKTPLLHDLHAQLQQRYKVELPPPAAQGEFDIRLVLESDYIFS